MAARLPEGLWRDATVATAERRFGDAADVLEGMGSKVLQKADLRLLDGRELALQGKARGGRGAARARTRVLAACRRGRVPPGEAEDVLAAAS